MRALYILYPLQTDNEPTLLTNKFTCPLAPKTWLLALASVLFNPESNSGYQVSNIQFCYSKISSNVSQVQAGVTTQ